MLFVIVVLSLACVVISYFVRNCRLCSFRTVNSLPGPIRLPFIGSTYYFLQRGPEDFLNNIIELGENYSSPFQVWVGTKLLIGIYEPNQVKTVLQSRSCLDKSTLYKLIEPLFGIGLLTAPASIWIKNRKMLAPIFSASMLQKDFNIFVQESLILAEELGKIRQSGNEIIFLEHIARCTMRISHDTMMGIKSETNVINQCLKAVERIKEIMRCRFRNVFLFPDIIFNFTTLGREQRKSINFLHSVVDKMIQQWTNESSTTTANNDTADKRLFNILISSSHNEKFTPKEILDNTLTLLATAGDTISVTINFAVFMLANFSEKQEKVYKELLEIYGTETPKSAPVKYEDLQYMHYLDRVIKETLRLFPTVPLIMRCLTEDLEIGEFVLPKGADVFIPFIRMHRNEKYWPNPLMFDPDRFLPENTKNCQSYYYVPFSDGPRNCIGMKYAMISMKVILATLVRTFVFKVNKNIEIDKIKVNMDMVLSTVEPLKIIIEKRNM